MMLRTPHRFADHRLRRRLRSSGHGRTALPAAVVATAVLAACSPNAGSEPELSPRAEEGRQLALRSGCASCHGASGEGGAGPAYQGLLGSTVELEPTDEHPETEIIADEAYLYESIREPGARKVAGYRIPMPSNTLDDDEVELIIAYITELSTGDADAGDADSSDAGNGEASG